MIAYRKDNISFIKVPATVAPYAMENTVQRLAMIVTPTCSEYVLDMRDVINLYSSVVNLIVSLHNRVTAAGGRLCIVNLNSHIETALRRLGIDRKIPFYPTMLDYELREVTAAECLADAA